MSNQLIDPALLFRMEVPVQYWDGKWTPKGLSLSEGYRIPCFSELSDRPIFADVRIGWNELGIAVQASVKGKRRCLGAEKPVWMKAMGFTFGSIHAAALGSIERVNTAIVSSGCHLAGDREGKTRWLRWCRFIEHGAILDLLTRRNYL